MSSASSVVTYNSVYTDSEPGRVFWGADEELSNGGSPRVIVYRYDGLPMQPVALPSPDYIPGLKEPHTPPVPQDEDDQDEHVLSVEEQPLPPVVSPTSKSPGYVAESNLKEDPEEYEDDKSEDGPVDYPMDGGDDGDDDEGDSSRDDADDEDEDKEDEKEEEEDEHLAPANSIVVIPTIELVSSPEGTELVIPPPSTDNTTTGARINVRLQASVPLPPEAEVERLLAMPTLPPSLLTSLSPPSAGMASTQALIDAVTTALPSPLLPPPLYIPPPVDRKDDIPETKMSSRKRFVSTIDSKVRRGEIGEFRYGIRDIWVDLEEAIPEIAPMTLGEVNTRVTELAELHEHDTQDLYALLEDALDSRTRISQRVTMDSQWVN
nr:hypothetical protein [Tanacetum cinerariifolium]